MILHIIILALGAPPSALPAQVNLLVDANSFGALLERPLFYDGLMIATALGPAVGHPLPGARWLASQRVRVEDSRAFRSGSVVEVYFEMAGGTTAKGVIPLPQAEVPIDPAGTLPVGERALLMAQVARQGKLLLQGRGSFAESENIPVVIDNPSTPAVLQKAFVFTAQRRLTLDAEPQWRLLGSLAAAIPGTGDENARTITDLISRLPMRQHTLAFGGPDDRLSKTFVEAVASDTAYHRALVDYALNKLAYWGYADRFSRDLREAAIDPNAFPDGVPSRMPFEEDTGSNLELPRNFRRDPPLTQTEILGVLARAKSPTIAAGFLYGLIQKPSETEIRSLARFLDSPDPRLRRAIVERLATWDGVAPPDEVRMVTDEGGKRRYEAPGLDEAVAFWKRMLAAPTSP